YQGFPLIFLHHCPFGCGKSGNSLYGLPGLIADLVTAISVPSGTVAGIVIETAGAEIVETLTF
ncbi:MAG: hypothetical protein ABGY10_08885, partial [bacterium]